MSNIELDPKGLIRVCASCGQRNRIPFSTRAGAVWPVQGGPAAAG